MENSSQITYRNSKTLEVPAREKRVIHNVCNMICQTIFTLMQFIFSLSSCVLNLYGLFTCISFTFSSLFYLPCWL